MNEDDGLEPPQPPFEQGISPEEQAERKERLRRLKQELVGDLLTTAEVAEILEIHPRTVGEYIREGRLPAINLGGGWKVSEHELRKFVAALTGVAALDPESGKARRRTKKSGERGIFERFSPLARKVIVDAQTQARELGHAYIGTEHIMLALAKPEGPLAELGLEHSVLKESVVAIVPAGENYPTGHIPFTPRSKRVLELNLAMCLELGHDEILPGHLLLALIDEGQGVAAKVLSASYEGGLNGLRSAVVGLMSEG